MHNAKGHSFNVQIAFRIYFLLRQDRNCIELSQKE
jgi:hypothetical protein